MDWRRFGLATAAASSCIAILVLAGWAFDMPALRRFLSGSPDMSPNAAMSALLAGLSLLGLHAPRRLPGRRWRGPIVLAAAALVFALGLATMVEFMADTRWAGLDLALLGERPVRGTTRMPMVMAANLVAGAAAIALLLRRGAANARASQILAAATLLGPIYSLALFGDDASTSLGILYTAPVTMAVPGTISWTLIVVSILAVRPRAGWVHLLGGATTSAVLGRRLLLAIFAIPIGIRILVTWASRQQLFAHEVGSTLLVLGSVPLLAWIVLHNIRMLARYEELNRRDQAGLLAATEQISIGEAKLRSVTDAFPVLVSYIDSGLRYRLNNNRYSEWFGLHREDLAGRSVVEVLGEQAANDLRPLMQRALDGETVEFEATVRYRTGPREIQGTYIPDRDASGAVRGFSALVSDIGARKKMDLDLRRSERRFRELADSMPQMVWTATPLGVLEYCNVRTFEYLGVATVKEITAGGMRTFAHPDDLSVYRASKTRAVRDGCTLEVQLRMRRFDGEWRWHLLRCEAAKDEEGRVERWYGTCTDIHAQVIAHEERRRAEEERALLRANERAAVEASRLKSEFLANMSHEIRTPMNCVIGMAGLLGQTALDADQRTFVEGISSSADALLAVIDDILDFSRIESGRFEIETDDFDLGQLFQGVERMFSLAAGRKGLDFDAEASLPANSVYIGDAARIRQVLANLVGNAVKFTTQGRVTVRVRVESSGLLSDKIRFEVEDTGIGISPSALRTLFQPFQQADTTVTRRHGGAGLGLSISRRLAELMGGEIGVRSREGKGSFFWFVITLERSARNPPIDLEEAAEALAFRAAHSAYPEDAGRVDHLRVGGDGAAAYTAAGQMSESGWAAAPDTAAAASPDAPGASRPAPGAPTPTPAARASSSTKVSPASRAPASAHFPRIPALEGCRVLVVEDNPVNQWVAMLQLERMGCRTRGAANGRDALDLLRSDDFDLVLMDCQMPVMDGFEATRLIRSGGTVRDARIPVIAMSASVIRGDRDRCLAAGMNDFLGKPISPAKLSMALASWLPALGSLAAPADAVAGRGAPVSDKDSDSAFAASGDAGSAMDAAVSDRNGAHHAAASGPSRNPGRAPIDAIRPAMSSSRPSPATQAIRAAPEAPIAAAAPIPQPSPGCHPGQPEPPSFPQQGLAVGNSPDGNHAVIDPSLLAELGLGTSLEASAAIERIVGLFMTVAPRKVASIERAWAAGDASMVDAEVHSLKSTAAGLGVLRLADLCARIESARQDSEIVSQSIRALAGEVDAACAALHAILREMRHGVDPSPVTPGPSDA